MSAVVFYEKPGCATNARQRALLERHGCRVIVRDLLTEPWSAARLYEFLRGRPVAEWFNPAAPKIRAGEIDPRAQDRYTAMTLLLREPLLIRRPLLDTAHGKAAGFDDRTLLQALGLPGDAVGDGHRDCARPTGDGGCPVSGPRP